jgi:hypothetical protein
MNTAFKTVEGTVGTVDPLIAKQREDVARMRTSLLACDANPQLASTALKNVTVLQVYHQISRIIRYTELCDKLESKLYESMDSLIDRLDTDSNLTINALLNAQERLQKLMIESNKMLAPFLDMTSYIESVRVDDASEDNAPKATIALDATRREKLRNSAKQVLLELNVG